MQIFPQFQRKIWDFGLQIYEILSSKWNISLYHNRMFDLQALKL
jgi:hypothetical protein